MISQIEKGESGEIAERGSATPIVTRKRLGFSGWWDAAFQPRLSAACAL